MEKRRYFPRDRYDVELGLFLKRARLNRNLAQWEVAAAVGCIRAFIGSIERAERPPPFDMLGPLASIYKISEFSLRKKLFDMGVRRLRANLKLEGFSLVTVEEVSRKRRDV